MQTITMPIVGFIKSGRKKIFARKDRILKIKESQLDHIRHTLAKADGLILDKIQNDRDMKFSDCLENMPAICRECQFNTDCHFTSGRPMLDKNAINNCEINNESRIAAINLVINRVLFE